MIDKKTLKLMREASGLTLAQVAAKTKLATQTCWEAERGRVSAQTAERIHKVLVRALEAKRAEADELLAKTAQSAA